MIVDMSGSPLLLRVYQMAANKFPDWMLYEAMFRHPKNLKSSLRGEQEQHRAIVEAILKHDAESAARAAREHLLSLGKDLHIYLNIPREKILEKEKQFTVSVVE
jgi:DNA-binding GntR family transcriptional regulator